MGTVEDPLSKSAVGRCKEPDFRHCILATLCCRSFAVCVRAALRSRVAWPPGYRKHVLSIAVHNKVCQTLRDQTCMHACSAAPRMNTLLDSACSNRAATTGQARNAQAQQHRARRSKPNTQRSDVLTIDVCVLCRHQTQMSRLTVHSQLAWLLPARCALQHFARPNKKATRILNVLSIEVCVLCSTACYFMSIKIRHSNNSIASKKNRPASKDVIASNRIRSAQQRQCLLCPAAPARLART